MNIESAFPKAYLSAKDILGRRVLVTIKDVTLEDLDDGTKPVLSFIGKEKGLVLNRTNASMLIEITGSDETNNWRGRQIVLYVTKVDFQGKRVDAIRIDHPGTATATAPMPAPVPAPAPVAASVLEDEIPF